MGPQRRTPVLLRYSTELPSVGATGRWKERGRGAAAVIWFAPPWLAAARQAANKTRHPEVESSTHWLATALTIFVGHRRHQFHGNCLPPATARTIGLEATASLGHCSARGLRGGEFDAHHQLDSTYAGACILFDRSHHAGEGCTIDTKTQNASSSYPSSLRSSWAPFADPVLQRRLSSASFRHAPLGAPTVVPSRFEHLPAHIPAWSIGDESPTASIRSADDHVRGPRGVTFAPTRSHPQQLTVERRGNDEPGTGSECTPELAGIATWGQALPDSGWR